MKIKRGNSTFHIYKTRAYNINEIGVNNRFLQNLPEYFNNHGETIFKARNEIKVFNLNGYKINVKKYCIPPIVNRVFYSVGIRTPKCKSAFLNASKILRAGFETPKPYAYIIERRNGLIRHSYLVSEQLENVTQIRSGKGLNLIKEFANYTAVLHEKGLNPIDYTPGNILFRRENGKCRFFLVDVNRFKFKNKPLNINQAPYNLYTTMSSTRNLNYFINCYANLRAMNAKYLIGKTFFLRYVRDMYNKFKRILKKFPGAGKLIGKPIGDVYKKG